MTRRVRDKNLETKAERKKLRARGKPYFRAINEGLHIGYRRSKHGGRWVVRQYVGGQRYKTETIGTADDRADADGVTVLNFAQAQELARSRGAELARQVAGIDGPAGPYTVKHAIDDWVEDRRNGGGRHGGRGLATARYAIEAHILPALGHLEIGKLSGERLAKWHQALAGTAARKRSKKKDGKVIEQCFRDLDNSPDAIRRRRATANRVLSILKAALNLARDRKKAPNVDAWRSVKPFGEVDRPVIRYLKAAECVRMVNACHTHFRPMVRAGILTGCRYGELVALQADDFDSQAGTLAVCTSKSGKSRHVVLTDEAREFFKAAAAGKVGSNLIFTRPDGEPWGAGHQRRHLLDACARAKISPAVSFHVLRHTHGSQLAMKGVPMTVIAAQLGHADTRITERHYAHLAPSYVADTIRANFPRLGIVDRKAPRRIA
jgi:integrase